MKETDHNGDGKISFEDILYNSHYYTMIVWYIIIRYNMISLYIYIYTYNDNNNNNNMMIIIIIIIIMIMLMIRYM